MEEREKNTKRGLGIGKQSQAECSLFFYLGKGDDGVG